MEDVFKFLLIAGVIIVGLVRQYKKEAKKNAGNNPAMPIPTEENPLPENWSGDTYGDYIPQGPKPEAPTPAPKKKAPAKYTDSMKQTTSPTPSEPQITEEPSEYGIHSAEEARRAIIWSEILQRKY